MELQDQKHGGKLVDRQSRSFFEFVNTHRVVAEDSAQFGVVVIGLVGRSFVCR